MRVIPVLDLSDGVVVRARFGDRASYRPIETPLSADAQPLHVAAGLMRVHPFDTLYVADLDGIAGRDRQEDAVDSLRRAFPKLELWVDAGFGDGAEAAAWMARTGARAVLGSETLASAAALPASGDRAVLSLDYRGGAFQGPEDILARPEIWATDVIAMTLARVGSGAGPDLDRLAGIRTLAGPSRRVYAAGGVRGPEDLRALAAAGVSGALVATALHDGRLDGPALAALAGL